MSSAAASRPARYQKGLMLRASTSMPWLSIAARRTLVSAISRPGASSGWSITAIAAGTQQWACTSTVLMRRPLTTTSRRRGPACAWEWSCPWPCDDAPDAAAASNIAQPVKTMPPGIAGVPVAGSIPMDI